MCAPCGAKNATLFFKHNVVCNACFMYTSFLCVFLNMFMFHYVKTMLKLKLMKYILLCPSDIYSMIQSLQTGMSKILWTHIRLPLKDKGH